MVVPKSETVVLRHKTAIRRGDYSRPLKCLLRDGLLDKSLTFLDYGCGRGEDLELLASDGFTCNGWDPAFRPDGVRCESDIVNLGFVINVIENPVERAQTLNKAWSLCRQVLSVSAQVVFSTKSKSPAPFADGVLTARNTFQKYYEQDELKRYLEAELQTEAVPAGIGIFYLFKDEARRQQFLANQFRRKEIAPRRRIAEIRLEETRQVLKPLMHAIAQLGRLPDASEFEGTQQIIERFGSLKRAFTAIQRITGSETWDTISRHRREDILVYLALSRFRKRPSVSHLPATLQRDIKVFFKTYGKACEEADALLFKAGDPSAIDEACRSSTVGKLLPDDLYVHCDALEVLDPVLRIYEGCGRAFLGEIEDANIIKIHRRSGKLSYLIYPTFKEDPHPALSRSIRVNLRTRQIDSTDYSHSINPPILHRKETFLPPEHALKAKFTKLTEQEDKYLLLDDNSHIGNLEGWNRRLLERGFMLKGHRLVRLPPE
jgi:DNA phosphorothioation-associated putative methyltransferase